MRYSVTSVIALVLLLGTLGSCGEKASEDLPNILWITVEDMSPNLGCYGDRYAHTPHLDQLAAGSVRYGNAFATAPVCAPARSTIITGMYAYSIGSQHMRSTGRFPANLKYFPEYLREAGYYCTNNHKEDYNLDYESEKIWDESGREAHWRNRSSEDQPFFAIFNLHTTHESRVNDLDRHQQAIEEVPDSLLKKPGEVPLPAFYPDTPEVNTLWARYYNNITAMDMQVGRLLADLKEDGLEGRTIVMFYSDHGAGLPVYKRWVFDTGLKVPLLVHAPEEYQHLVPHKMGTATDELVSFVDLAPTALNLAGMEKPGHMQGRAFLGSILTPRRKYIHAGRDRMDERYDMQRVARNSRFKYIRYYEAYKPYIQYMNTPEKGAIMRAIRNAGSLGTLPSEGMRLLAESKPFEALYDLVGDPHEINDLANDPAYADELAELRYAHENWTDSIRDTGLIPETIIRHWETEFDLPVYLIMRQNAVPVKEIREMASAVDPRVLMAGLGHENAAVRYWALIGLGNVWSGAVAEENSNKWGELSSDPVPVVRIALARLYCNTGNVEEGLAILKEELAHEDEWVRLSAIQVLDEIGALARPAIDQIRAVMNDQNKYVVRVANHALNNMLETKNIVR